jgi:hypothetical protein
MYKVTINGNEKEVQAQGLTIDKGTIIFFCDKECTQSKLVVNSGKWDSIEVVGDSDALQIRKTKSIPQDHQAGSSIPDNDD